MQMNKNSLLNVFIRNPTNPTKVPSPNAVDIVKLDPCYGFIFWLNYCERVKQRAKMTEFDRPYTTELRTKPKDGLTKWITNKSTKVLKNAKRQRNFNLEEVFPPKKGRINLKIVIEIQ